MNTTTINNASTATTGTKTATITKQIELLNAISQLSAAATIVDNNDIVMFYREPLTNALVPVANEKVQSSFVAESLLAEIRASVLEAMDTSITQLDAMGLTMSAEALAELQSTGE